MKTLNELGISPAPWRMSPTVGDVENTVTENFETHDNTICTCWGTMQEMAADARLIAAAPRMYEALEECERKLDASDPYCNLLTKVRNALAAASGESEEVEQL